MLPPPPRSTHKANSGDLLFQLLLCATPSERWLGDPVAVLGDVSSEKDQGETGPWEAQIICPESV